VAISPSRFVSYKGTPNATCSARPSVKGNLLMEQGFILKQRSEAATGKPPKHYPIVLATI
jgi:hypothetical protein